MKCLVAPDRLGRTEAPAHFADHSLLDTGYRAFVDDDVASTGGRDRIKYVRLLDLVNVSAARKGNGQWSTVRHDNRVLSLGH